jgi:hypothetical protein
MNKNIEKITTLALYIHLRLFIKINFILGKESVGRSKGKQMNQLYLTFLKQLSIYSIHK